jgi:hypothetical protein
LQDLEITTDAKKSLQTFCAWQHKQNVKSDADAGHYDTAVLMTRYYVKYCVKLRLIAVSGKVNQQICFFFDLEDKQKPILTLLCAKHHET